MSHLHRRRRRRRRFDAASSRFLTVTFLFEQGCYILSQEKEVGGRERFAGFATLLLFSYKKEKLRGKKKSVISAFNSNTIDSFLFQYLVCLSLDPEDQIFEHNSVFHH